ncbi:hypothetical protein [Demequina soli]|uniref:hypothetical protein n=1 Tax=Demequina soli TaxID=1638987 RepID=UPI0007862A2E|nr:hypothetical protein [Demequina soli]
MTFRRRLAVLAASSLLLAGCAVPGQPEAPGVAASYQGATVTTADLDALAQSWDAASQGYAVPTPRILATWAALGPDAVAQAREDAKTAGTDLGLNDGNVRKVAEQWFTGLGAKDPVITDDVVASMTDMLGIYLVIGGDTSLDTITRLSQQVEDEGTFSPRLGEYSTDALIASINDAIASAQNMSGNYFMAFAGVNAFQDTTAPWAARG